MVGYLQSNGPGHQLVQIGSKCCYIMCMPHMSAKSFTIALKTVKKNTVVSI